jgi:two-component system sensor histidine kinase/response regulator
MNAPADSAAQVQPGAPLPGEAASSTASENSAASLSPSSTEPGVRAAPKPWRIRSSLALLIAACLLPGMLLSSYFIVSAYSQQKAYAIRDAQATARAVAVNLDRDLASVESGLRVLATSSALATDDLRGFHAQARMALPYQHISNYVLLDRTGRQRVNTLRPWGEPLPLNGGPPELQGVFETDRSVLTDVFIGPVTGQPILAMAVPVQHRGKTVYSLGAGLFPERIVGVLNSQNLPPEWIAAVLDSKGHITARSRGMALYVGKPAAPALIEAAKVHREGVIEAITLEGIPVFTAYSRSNLFGWTVAVGVPVSVLTSDLKKSMLLLLGASAVAFAGALVLAWQLVMHRIVMPADRLLARMRRMSRGEDPGPNGAGQTSQEFAALDQGFADMGVRLQQREREREATLAAQAANRAKTEFLSRMSHELRTPLNAVLGFAQVLQLDQAERLTPRQYEMVDQIARSGQHLLEMITDVLDVSRIESGSLQVMIADIDLHEMAAECRQMIAAPAAAANLKVTIGLPQGPAAVRADKTRLKQVLINLMSNAVKYNRPGGEVMLSVEPHGTDWRITVRDSGIGMNAEQMSHLFEPFNRLGRENNGTPGTGIGLVISKRLLEMMDSRLAFDSEARQGSTFWFDLPRVDTSDTALPSIPASPPASGLLAQAAFASDEDIAAPDLRPRHILYVEDNATNREIMRMMLAMRPHWQLRFETHVQAAKQALDTASFDLVLLDMHLPDGGGLELLYWLRQHSAHGGLPVIMVSADVANESIALARKAGAWAYLPKPLDVRHTLDMIDMVLRQHA